MRRCRRTSLIGSLIALAALLAACGEQATQGSQPTEESQTAAESSLGCEDTFPDVYAELEGLEGEERRARLVELAQAEGVVSVYSTNSAMEEVGPIFEEEFDIRTEVYRAPSNTVSQRVHEEAAAGDIRSDVIDNIAELMVIAHREGLIADYEGPIRDELPDVALGTGFTANQYVVYVAGWNPDALPEGGAPSDWEDFADPRWAGVLSLDPRHDAMYSALHQHFTETGMSEEEFQEMFRSIGENAVLVEGGTERANSVVSGEHSASIGIFAHAVDRMAADGAPITWQPAVEPIYVEPVGAGLAMCAAHPAAALLFYEWVATDGQDEMAALHRVTTPEFAAGGRLEGLELLLIDYGAYVDERQRWESEFHELIGYQ